MALPKRFIGYGAYNLANDRELGAIGGTDTRNFFQYLSDGGWPVNLVRVWVFRNATIEGLPSTRAIRLYRSDHSINPNYLDNLELLVKEAAQRNFWVQVSLFPYHAIADINELPENVPPELQPDFDPTLSDCARLRKFFQPSQNATTQKQKELIYAVATRLATKPNVLWEIGNELRMDTGDCGPADNRDLAAWVGIMKDTLVSVVGTSAFITTSTGTLATSEAAILNNVPFNFFDFHGGQWGISPGDLQENILEAKRRAASYNPNAFLIINDDGVPKGAHTPGAIGAWASKAFSLGLHYATKSPYPPQPWSTDTLNQLKIADRNFPA